MSKSILYKKRMQLFSTLRQKYNGSLFKSTYVMKKSRKKTGKKREKIDENVFCLKNSETFFLVVTYIRKNAHIGLFF